MPGRLLVGLLLLASLAGSAALAQYEEDERTRDHERQDRLYQQRYEKPDPTQQTDPDPAQREKEYISFVDKLIRDKHYRAATGDRYRVQTDDPRLDPDGALQLLDAFRDFFDEQWADRVQLAPYDKRSRVALFYSFYKYNQLLGGDFRFSPVRPKGHYGSSYDVITIHTDADSSGGLSDTLVHEAAHQLLDRRLHRGKMMPTWIAEGMASYYGYTAMDSSGKFQPGRIGGKQVNIYRDGKLQPSPDPANRLKLARKALRGSSGSDAGVIEGLLWLEPQNFYGNNPVTYYGLSWVLVHFLMHGDDGAHVDAFVRYLEDEAAGTGGPERLYELLGMDAAAVEAAVVAHAKRMKVR